MTATTSAPVPRLRRRLERLAQPNYRHDSRRNKSVAKPNLSVGPDPIWPIPKAALRAQPTPHVSRLSIAPSRKLDMHADTSRSRAAHSCGSVTSRVSARLEALSKPRLPFV
ncbi:uncharacterized protein LOC117653197 [Thrips palmi]|uniref:Uncharacterized protein LOC117653197 n=1 Tax=Thrips palmi TaxID=161013 RepID=A0A6P9A959_THRPL|nr:uncharacterized protein LOC117653197 [Thrips palmi]